MVSPEKITYFIKDGVKHRIGGKFVFEYERGYSEPSQEFYNIVQRKEKFLFFFTKWVEIECEHVPSHVWISQATTGWHTWKSEMIARYRVYGFFSESTGAILS